MFTKADGPTALRADLVHALCFSKAAAKVDFGGELSPAVAGIAAVWNGRKGFIALVVRRVDPPLVERWVWDGVKLRSQDALESALAKAVEFAAALGLRMDAPGFAELDEAERNRRLHSWNKLRKLRKGAADTLPGAVSARASAPAPLVADEASDPDMDLPVPSGAPARSLDVPLPTGLLDIAPEDITGPAEIPPAHIAHTDSDEANPAATVFMLADAPRTTRPLDVDESDDATDLPSVRSARSAPEAEEDDDAPADTPYPDLEATDGGSEGAFPGLDSTAGDIDPNAEVGPDTAARPEELPRPMSARAPAHEVPEERSDPGKTVLARVALVRRTRGDERRIGPLERLLALF